MRAVMLLNRETKQQTGEYDSTDGICAVEMYLMLNLPFET